MSFAKWIADPNDAEARAALATFDLAAVTPARLRWLASGYKDSRGKLVGWVKACERAGIECAAANAIYANAEPGVGQSEGNSGVFVVAAIERGYVYGPASQACRVLIDKKNPGDPDGYALDEIETIMGGPLPDDHAQAMAYARMALRRLEAHDEVRFSQAWHLGSAPDEMTALWNEIAHENTLKARSRATARERECAKPPRLTLAASNHSEGDKA